jgi:malyl-CoA/(S)-citramalyl-CoA lyase
MRTTNVGGPNEDYAILTHETPEGRLVHWNDLWHSPISKMATIGRAHGLRIIDGPFGDFSDPDGYNAQGKRTAILGCEGKWAIHPNQVELANNLFTPKTTTIERAKKIITAMQEAEDSHQGAATLDGKLIDAASVRQAQQLITQQELIDSMN